MIDELRTAGASAKDPSSYSWITYAWVFSLAMLGCIVRVLREMGSGAKTAKQLLLTFVKELATSVFAGVITFYSCEAAEIRPLITAVMVSISGWMGVRALQILETMYRARLGQPAE